MKGSASKGSSHEGRKEGIRNKKKIRKIKEKDDEDDDDNENTLICKKKIGPRKETTPQRSASRPVGSLTLSDSPLAHRSMGHKSFEHSIPQV